MEFILRKWVCRLDKKFRLVLPLEARQDIKASDSVLLVLNGDKLVITLSDGEDGRLVSRNCKEVINGQDSVVGSTGDCGSPSPSSNLGSGPAKNKKKVIK